VNQTINIENLPEIIPIFPLNKCVLLPKAILPLNIFEPRYLEMIEDAIKSDKYIGIVQPSIDKKKKSETENVGCIGKISTYVENEDGTFIVKLTGICRFKIIEEVLSEKLYRKMKVDYHNFIDDLNLEEVANSIDRNKLLNVISDYLNVNDLTTDWSVITDTDTEILINAFAMLVLLVQKKNKLCLKPPI